MVRSFLRMRAWIAGGASRDTVCKLCVHEAVQLSIRATCPGQDTGVLLGCAPAGASVCIGVCADCVCVFRCVGEWVRVHAGRIHLSQGVRVFVRIFLYVRACLYVYVAISGYVWVCMHLYVFMSLNIGAYGCVYICVCMYLYVCVYLFVRICVWVCVDVSICVCVSLCMCVWVCRYAIKRL